MSDAAIGGHAASLEAAVAEAARILGASRCAVVGGLATDAAGAAAAVALAGRIGGVIDHAHSGPLLRDLEVMRTAGWMVATPPEARARADLALLVGPGAAWPGVAAAPVLPPGAGAARRIIRLGGGRDAPIAGAEAIAASPADLPGLIGALRAIAAGRPVRLPTARLRMLSKLAEHLKSARYGVVSWSAGVLDALTIEMLCGLIDDLNAHTRFAGLPLAQPGNAAGVAQTCGALTGFPVRVGFGLGAAEHDPWRFDAARMIAAGEADAALWIDAIAGSAPDWDVTRMQGAAGDLPLLLREGAGGRGTGRTRDRAAPPPTPTLPRKGGGGRLPEPHECSLIALTAAGARFAVPPAVAIRVARPGAGHDAVLFDPALGTLVARKAETASEAPSAAGVLDSILAALPC